MAGPKSTEYHPIIYTYLKRYQDDPSSRVFAPLAEAYRKAGLIDEAIEIAREGLQLHPNFIGGRVALARALFEKGSYDEVLAEVTPIVREIPDNLAAQRLLAESCLMLGRITEALGAYKMLLYFAPDDPETARLVQELEAQAYKEGALVLRTDPPPPPAALFAVKPAAHVVRDDPAIQKEKWVRKVEFLQELLSRVAQYRAAAP
jgi:tetratricopeptide (TPR) repeat protein